MNAPIATCGFCRGEGCSACDPLAEPACARCEAPTAAECLCVDLDDDDEPHARSDYAPDAIARRW